MLSRIQRFRSYAGPHSQHCQVPSATRSPVGIAVVQRTDGRAMAQSMVVQKLDVLMISYQCCCLQMSMVTRHYSGGTKYLCCQWSVVVVRGCCANAHYLLPQTLCHASPALRCVAYSKPPWVLSAGSGRECGTSA